tara:strand:- start:6411 stop:7499 length:1089 start_codon:yes stop_codon:yes gene_type:complete
MALTLHGTVSDNTVVLDRRTAKPLIINGDMAVAQRGTSVTGITGNSYNAIDRMKTLLGDNGTWTHTQDTDVPTGQGFANSWELDCTTADTSVASGAFHTASYFFEGQDLQLLKKGTSSAEKVTISFWIKTTVTGTYIAELFDVDNSRQISQAYTVTDSNTWEKKVLSFAGDTTGALDDDNANSFILNLWLGAGSDFSGGTLSTTWTSSTNANRAVGQVNGASSTSNNIYITGLQMEVGDFDANSIAPFQHESYGDNLASCERYFQKSYPQGTPVGNAANTGRYYFVLGADSGTRNKGKAVALSPSMRAAPTVTFYNDSGTSGTLQSPAANGITLLNSTCHFNMYVNTGDPEVYGHWTAEAEL